MPDRTSTLTLQTAIDQQKLRAAQQSIAALEKRVNSLEQSLKALQKTSGSASVAVSKDLNSLSAASISARNAWLKGTQAITEQMGVLQRYQKILRETQREQGNQPAAAGGAAAPIGGSSKLATGAMALGGVLRTAGMGEAGDVASGIGQIANLAKQAGPALSGLGASIGEVAVAGPIAAAAVIAVSLALKKFMEEMEAGKARVEGAIGAQAKFYELIQTGTSEEIKQGLADLENRRKAQEAIRRDTQAAFDAIKQQYGLLADVVLQTSGLNDQMKQQDTELQNTQFQIDAYNRALKSSEVAANDARKANEGYAATLQQRADEQAKIAQQAQQEEQRISQQAAEQEAAILLRAADQRIALAQRVAQQEQDALTKLQRDLAEGRIQLEQRQADARLQYQRDEAQSARSHYHNLLTIRKDAEADEFELVLNRDFAGLAKLRRDTDRRLGEEDERYIEERKQRLTALKNQLGDQQKAFIREREQRIRQYQQQLTDLRQVQVRELQAINEAAQIDIQRLHEKLEAELQMKSAAYTRALQLESDYLRIREQLLAHSITAAQAEFQQMQSAGTLFSSIGSQKRMEGLASGGPLGAGQIALVNEGFSGQRESFRTGGKSGLFPNAMGLFMPLKSGNVDPGGRGNVSIPISLTVNGNSYADIRRRVHADLDIQLSAAFEELAS